MAISNGATHDAAQPHGSGNGNGPDEAGIVIGDSPEAYAIIGITVAASPTGPSQDDLVDHNTSTGNQPDLDWDLQGAHVRFSDNQCRTSQPATLCNSN